MNVQKPGKTPRARSAPPAPPLSGSIGLTFLSSEQPRALVPLPSFKDRLQATDTWNARPWTSYSMANPAATAYSRDGSPDSTETLSFASQSRSWRASSSSSSSIRAETPSTSVGASEGRRRKSKSPEEARHPDLSAADRRALRLHQDAAVQRAVSSGNLRAESYTDGMLYAIRKEAENDFMRTRRSASSRPSGDVESTASRKRRHSGLEGHQGQVASAVKVRKVDDGNRKRVVGADEGESNDIERAGPVQVEVDLRKLLGI